MKTLKFIGIFLLVLLALFICYGIYYAVMAYFFFVKLLIIAAIIAGALYIYHLIFKKNK